MSVCVLDTSVARLLYAASPLLPAYSVHLQNTKPVISFQTVAEMRYGALKSNWGAERRRKLEAFLASLQVIEYTDELANRWAEVMLQARTAGRRMEAGDAWIAATAALLNAPLLTHDKDFGIEALPSITIHRYIP